LAGQVRLLGQRIGQALARRHLQHGTLVLHDVTSTYFEGPVLAAAA
jgi:hypothetical protein